MFIVPSLLTSAFGFHFDKDEFKRQASARSLEALFQRHVTVERLSRRLHHLEQDMLEKGGRQNRV